MDDKQKNRNGGNQESHFRSGRFYPVAGQWYFCVRENEDQGPYPSKSSAEESLKTYLLDFEHFNADRITKLKFN